MESKTNEKTRNGKSSLHNTQIQFGRMPANATDVKMFLKSKSII